VPPRKKKSFLMARAEMTNPMRRFLSVPMMIGATGLGALSAASVSAAEEPAGPHMRQLDAWALLEAGGTIGWIIMALSLWMVALIVQHLITVRRGALMPAGLAEEVHRLIGAGNYPQAQNECSQRPSFEAYVLEAGLAETRLGYSAVEKAMEDASQQQAARIYRKLEYFTVIGTIAPMLGLLGTVWGMILAFMEFEAKANPQVSELAPGIYRALVTTLQGLCVAIPALGAYAILRNRVDELVAETTLLAEYVFSGFKRSTLLRRQEQRRSRPVAADAPATPQQEPAPPEQAE
jgi:biopolymer transport protein ExbB